jgi:hyperosmotically inducible periplasmic protein
MRKTTTSNSGITLRTAFAATVLSGAIAAAPLTNAAEQASPAPDVRAAVGEVEGYVTDSMLTARVKLALLDAPDLSALQIGVRTDRGVVQLSGFVDDPARVRRATEVASRVPGVVSVQNKLEVKS